MDLLLRLLVVFAIEHAPPWLPELIGSPLRLLVAEYATVAVLVAIVVLVTRADMRRKGA
jgi:hypothetical protein